MDILEIHFLAFQLSHPVQDMIHLNPPLLVTSLFVLMDITIGLDCLQKLPKSLVTMSITCKLIKHL